jgi:hypothetical protein
MPAGKSADIVHWSHSGYHVRDALGNDRDDPRAIELALNMAVDKMWAALGSSGLMFSVHQTRDISDGVPSQMLPVSHKYCGALDDVPERIEKRIGQLGGYVATLNFASPLKFPELSDARWEALKRSAQWDHLDSASARTLRLLNFIAHDFADPAKAALEKLATRDNCGLCRRVQIDRRNKWRLYHRKMRISDARQINGSGEPPERHRPSTAQQVAGLSPANGRRNEKMTVGFNRNRPVMALVDCSSI